MRKAFICPTKYVQGENELENLGFFVKNYGDSAFVVATDEDMERVSSQLDATAKKFGVRFVPSGFGGKCTKKEVERLRKAAADKGCSCTIGLGGGQAIDASKCVAQGESLLIVPTIAATDSPTSHSAVLYTEEGFFDEYAYFKNSPNLVLIDTSIIAKAPVRFLISGMGDALATYFEARATAKAFATVNAGLPCGALEGDCPPAHSTKTAQALARLCYETLLEDGSKAKAACECGVVTQALENIVEANILLSGIGFESGGLAAAHAIHDGMTVLPDSHHNQHGEKVAFGTLVQLVLENAPEEELYEVLDFCLEIGLPVCLSDLGVDDLTDDDLRKVAKKACDPEESLRSMPFPISEDMVIAAILTADRIGYEYREAFYGVDEDYDDESENDDFDMDE